MRGQRTPAALAALAALVAVGCSSYAGTARSVSAAAIGTEPGWIAIRKVPYLEQQREADCGAAAIAMVVSYWTHALPRTLAETLRPAPARGIKARRLRAFAREHGLESFLVEGRVDDLARELRRGRPVIVGLIKPQRSGTLAHYEVVVAFHPERRLIVTLDPAEGWRQNTIAGFLAEWEPAGHLTLIVSGTRPARPVHAR